MHHFSPQVLSTLCLLSFCAIIHGRSDHAVSQKAEANTPACHQRSSEILEPQFFPKYNSKRIKTTYGPYTVPSMHEDNGMISFGGLAVPPPCTDCLITYIHAGLTYPNGTAATAATGMWLHHTVWTNLARPDPESATCPSHKHPRGDRFFASGNERTPVDLTANGSVKAGYPIYDGDVIAMGGELMNMRHDSQEVQLTMIFEFVPRVEKRFRKVQSYWVDVGGCEGSNVPARENAVWELESPDVVVGNRGKVVFVASHLHDGGVRQEVMRNGEVVCESVAGYDGDGQEGNGGAEHHIDSLSTCAGIGKTKKGDRWSVRSYYDTTLHAPMRNMDGSLEPVMGISLVYVAVGGKRYAHKKLRVFLGVGIAAMTVALVVMWARLNGRDWVGRKKGGAHQHVRLLYGEEAKDGGMWVSERRYRDEE